MKMKIFALAFLLFSLPLHSSNSSTKPAECLCKTIDPIETYLLLIDKKIQKNSAKEFALAYGNQLYTKSELRETLQKNFKLSVEKSREIANQLTFGTERQR